ncbi:MAG: GHKL domain-containing protein [Saprospiraceae bacterium]|nr:GHKL domain-containing protein [Saprospiraceae bacterium]
MWPKAWGYIVNIGAYDHLQWSEKIKVRLLNKLLFICVFVTLLLMVSRYFFFEQTVIPQIRIIFIISICFLFHFKGNYLLPRYIACFIFPISVALLMCREGGVHGEHSIFFAISFIGFIFFERQVFSKFLCVAWNVFLGIYCLVHVHHHFDYNPISSNLFGSIIIFSSIMAVISLFIYFNQKDVFGYEHTRERLLDELQKKNTELERFAYAASHDLKEPLNNIIGFGEILKDNFNEKEYDNSVEYLDIITSNASHMSNLVRDTLEVIAVENEQIAYDVVDPNIIIHQIRTLISETINKKSARVIIQRKLPVVKAHKSELFSLFKNLIENGLKYNDDPSPYILIDFLEYEDKTVFKVADNGYGIKKSEQSKIFEMFQRLHIRTEHEGSGLGLSICKKIVEKMGGIIWVESKPGEGATFYFSIPKTDMRVKIN